MRIAVCFKVITDYDQVPSSDWKELGLMRFSFVKKIFGVFDEAALETALRIKDEDNSTYIEAISLGKEDRIFTEALFSAGFDQVTYLDGKSDFKPITTANVLSSYIKENSFDLVLCGEVVGPNDSGQVPYLIAKNLGFDLISKVTNIEKGIIHSETENEELEFQLSNNIVIVISNAKYPYLRFGSFKEKEKAKEIKAKVIPIEYARKKIKLKKAVQNNRDCEMIELSNLVILIYGGEKNEC